MSCSHWIEIEGNGLCLDDYFIRPAWEFPWPPPDDPRYDPAMQLINVIFNPRPVPWRERLIEMLGELDDPRPVPWITAFENLGLSEIDVNAVGNDLERIVTIANAIQGIKSPALRERLGGSLQRRATEFIQDVAPGALLTLSV
jgi:hypothetical protein